MSERLEEIENLSTEEIYKKYNEAASTCNGGGISFWQTIYSARKQDELNQQLKKINEQMLSYTKAMTLLTVVVMIATIITLVVTIKG